MGCGLSTIRMCPPLAVTNEEADVALDVLEECIQESGQIEGAASFVAEWARSIKDGPAPA